MKRSTKKQIISVFVLIVFSGSVVTYAITAVIPSQEQVQPDWKAGLAITIFNSLQPIPPGIGVENETYAKLFTLSSDGLILKSVEESVSLGEFFEIWGENFNSTCIFDYCNNENNSMEMFVNGIRNSDFELYSIKNNDFIQIDYR